MLTSILFSLSLLALGMALTLEDALKVKQRSRWDTRKPGVSEVFRALWKHLEALRNPDLQFVAYSGLNAGEQVVANVPAKLYAVYAAKPAASTTTAFLKLSDHATATQAGASLVIPFVGTGGGGQTHAAVFPDGLLFNTGITINSTTTGDGTMESAAADAPTGFCIVGAA